MQNHLLFKTVPGLLYLASIVLSGCASLPDNSGRTESHAYTDVSGTFLGQNIARSQKENKAEDGFLPLGNGLDAFVARAVLAEIAERSIDAQYYLYHQDEVGGLFTGVLWRAAKKGVRVRLLVDDMDMAGRDETMIVLDQHPNIEVRIFNPFNRELGRGVQYVTGFGSLTRRMHNKSFTVDNSATIVGGRNIGNEYYDANPELEFADLDVLTIGNVVPEVSNAFDLYWNSELAYPVTTIISERPSEDRVEELVGDLRQFMKQQRDSAYMRALKNSSLAEKIRQRDVMYFWGDASIVVDHPGKITQSRDATELHLMKQLEPHFENLKSELIIVSPYFVPGDEGVDFFKALIDRGVSVKILTNSLASNDVGIVHAGYSNYRKALLRTGVKLFEMNKKLTKEQRKQKKEGSSISGSSKASLHAKTFVLDREKVFIGSLNLDPRSFYENTEIGLILDSKELAGKMAAGFDEEITQHVFRLELHYSDEGDEYIIWHGRENGQPVEFEVDPYSSFWRRFFIGLMSLLPIESQL